jgi:hypothetical protein
MKQYIISENLLDETIAGLNVFGGVAVADTVDKLKQLKEIDPFESSYQNYIHNGYEGLVMRPSNPYNPIAR